MTFHDPKLPLCILLFDDTEAYHQPFTQALCTGNTAVKCRHVKTAHAFREALTGAWDLCFVAYPVAQEALVLMQQESLDCSCILLYRSEEEAGAFSLINDIVSDLISLDEMRRLPLILRREWKQKHRQLHADKKLDQQGTEEKLAEKVAEGKRHLQLLVEHAPAAIAMLDQDMKYLSVSRRWLMDYRLDESAIIGRSHYEVFPEIPERWREVHQRCLQGAVETCEADRFPRADGTIDWVHWNVHPWRDSDGGIGGIILFSEVITERKLAEVAEQEQRLLAEAMRDSLEALTSSLDVETVMQQILAYSARVVPSDAGAIVLFTGNQGHVVAVRGHKPETLAFFEEHPIALDTGMFTHSHAGHPYYFAADTRLIPEWVLFPVTDWIRSSIGVQIILDDEPIGLLIADSATPNQFQQKDIDNLQTFARYAALALKNAHHVTHLEQRVRERTAELEAAKTQVETILNHNPDGILLMRADLHIQQANLAFRRLFGYAPDEQLNRSLVGMIYEPDVGIVSGLVTVATGEQTEIRAVRKDGTLFNVELSVSALSDDGFVCMIRDITERKAWERQLRFQAGMQKIVSAAVIVTDMQSRIQSWNEGAERIYGWSAAEAVGKFTSEILRTQISADERARHIAQLAEQGWWQWEFLQCRKDGTFCHILSSAAMMYDEHGTALGLVAVNHDITERKQAEEALRASEEKYRLLVESMRGGLVVFDTTDRMTYVNDRFCELLGYSREELIGTKAFDYVDAVNAATIQSQIEPRRLLKNTSYEIVARRKDGQQINLLVLGSPLPDDAGNYNGGFAILTDITTQKQAEAALRQALAKEQELGELKSRFVSTASHEFRTPLATISATAETLLAYRNRLTPQQLDERLRKILTQVNHMKEMMEDVLQLARIHAGRVKYVFEKGDLDALCRDIIEEFRSHTNYAHRIHYTGNCSGVQLQFDQRLMRHIISNLIVNGLKYSPEEESITVNLHQTPEAVTLKISDQGIGIPNAELQRIFEPFHRATNVGTISGTGLGLSITKEAIELHGGTIDIDTEIDVGSTVTVTFPANHIERKKKPTLRL